MARSVRLDPRTGLPTTRVVSPQAPPRIVAPAGTGPSYSTLRVGSLGTTAPAASGPLGPRSAAQVPYSDYGFDANGNYVSNTSKPLIPPPSGTGTAGASPSSGSGDGSGGGGGGGGSGPPVDYAALVAADPGLQALRAELAAGNISAAQYRKQAIDKAVIAYGAAPDAASLDPATAGFYNQDVDQLTRDLAGKNTSEGLSTVALQDRAHQVALNGLRDVLATRGMLQSGGLGVGIGLEGQRDKSDRAKAVGELLDYLSGQAQAYAEHLHQSKLQEAQAIQDTTLAYMQLYSGGLGGSGGGGGGGGSSSGLENSNQFGGGSEIDAATSAYLASHPGYKAHMVMQEGIHTNPDGSRYVMIKFATPTGDSTEMVPLPPVQSSTPAPPAAPPASTPAPVAPPAPAPPPVSTPVPAGTVRPGGYF